MAPEPRFVPRFAAEPPQEQLPYGRWAERLGHEFLAACLRIDTGGEDIGVPGELTWFPDRTWNGRTYVPATTRTPAGYEIFGHVSFVVPEGEEPGDFESYADFTAETADANPDWKLDLCDDVVGTWRGELLKVAAMTLVWGVPLVTGGADRHGRARRPRRRPVRPRRGPLHALGARRLPRRHARHQAVRRAWQRAGPRVALRGRRGVMDAEEAIRTRRTHKAYAPEPVDRETLAELLDLARWAPNHNLTNPWRFRVLGPASLERLKEAAGPEAASKLDRAPTLVAVSVVQPGEDPIQDEEDLLATGHRGLHRAARRPRARLRRLLAHAGGAAHRRRARRPRHRRRRADDRPAAPRPGPPGAGPRPSARRPTRSSRTSTELDRRRRAGSGRRRCCRRP